MKAKIMGRVVEILDERLKAGDRLSGGYRRGAGDVGATHERRESGTNTSRVKSGGRTTSPTNALPGWPKPSDKWNYSFAQHLEMEKQAGRIKLWFYEPFSFWLVPADPSKGERGIRHKVDFMVWYPDGLERPLHMIEVKGHGRSKNLRDGITRFKVAADKFPCFQWSMVKRKNHGWEAYGA